jgi:hypothetical protein
MRLKNLSPSLYHCSKKVKDKDILCILCTPISILGIHLVQKLKQPSLKTKTKLRGLSPRANYTDRATAACRRSDCQLLRVEGETWSA